LLFTHSHLSSERGKLGILRGAREIWEVQNVNLLLLLIGPRHHWVK
jgi:hypothetical protein